MATWPLLPARCPTPRPLAGAGGHLGHGRPGRRAPRHRLVRRWSGRSAQTLCRGRPWQVVADVPTPPETTTAPAGATPTPPTPAGVTTARWTLRGVRVSTAGGALRWTCRHGPRDDQLEPGQRLRPRGLHRLHRVAGPAGRRAGHAAAERRPARWHALAPALAGARLVERAVQLPKAPAPDHEGSPLAGGAGISVQAATTP
jgi:hypothetical protein